MAKRKHQRKHQIFWIFLLAFICVGLYLLYLYPDQQAPTSETTEPGATGPTKSEPLEPKGEIYSVVDPNSIWFVVNKQNPLPLDYVPKKLVVPNMQLNAGSGAEYMHVSSIIAKDLENMVNQAKRDGNTLVLSSGYRSSSLQTSLYQSYVNQDGKAQADTYSARPGYSEHQTGLALDVHSAGEGCVIEQCWSESSGGKWVANNAHNYGFIVRYPGGKQNIVGYSFEPWHLRYVGVEVATKIYEQDITLEEFLGFDPAPGY